MPSDVYDTWNSAIASGYVSGSSATYTCCTACEKLTSPTSSRPPVGGRGAPSPSEGEGWGGGSLEKALRSASLVPACPHPALPHEGRDLQNGRSPPEPLRSSSRGPRRGAAPGRGRRRGPGRSG